MQGYDTADIPSVKRKVPWDVACHLFFSGKKTKWGLIPLFAGLALVYTTTPAIVSGLALHGKISHVVGTVTLSQDTGASVGSKPVYENRYKYTTNDGKVRAGVSFGSPESTASNNTVDVLYSAKDPDVSIIQGQKATRESFFAGIIYLVPLIIGLYLVAGGLSENLKVYRLLQKGQIGEGILVKKVQTDRTVNQHPYYHYVYTYTFESGHVVRMNVVSLEWLNQEILVLFQTHPIEDAIVLAGVPGKVILINNKLSSDESLWPILILPATSIVLGLAIVFSVK